MYSETYSTLLLRYVYRCTHKKDTEGEVMGRYSAAVA